MRYCTKCLYPDTKPDLTFNQAGICSACEAFDARKNINWQARQETFHQMFRNIKGQFIYDCVIPVSGGKDSTYQVIKALEYGLKPLAVTATTDDLSIIGRRNLNNISKLGVDHIEVSVNSKVRRKLNKFTLMEIGDISWAEHVTIFTIPVKEAKLRSIPYILWGENPQNEYGGPNDDAINIDELGQNWLQEFGGLNGLRVSDIIDANVATPDDMWQYRMPDARFGTFPKGLFLGHYFPWDGKENAHIAAEHGFEFNPGPVEGCGERYENLDNHQTGIHDYFKYLKFGFGRATDLACNNIRRGRISRDEGKEFILEFDGQFPRTYLGKPLEDILKRIDVTMDEFIATCDKFTNKDIFYERRKTFSKPLIKETILEA